MSPSETRGHAYGLEHIADHGTNELLAAAVQSNTTYILYSNPQPDNDAGVADDAGLPAITAMGPIATQGAVVAAAVPSNDSWQLVAFDLEHHQSLNIPLPTGVGVPADVTMLALTPTTLYWSQQAAAPGLHAVDLQSGAHRQLGSVAAVCQRACARADESIICMDLVAAALFRIRGDTGELTPFDDVAAAKQDGSCSPDNAQLVWIDYREAPGSSIDGARSGGEVYVHSLASGASKRITYDSPDSPRQKAFPAVDGDLVVWRETCSTCDPDPDLKADLYENARTIVKTSMSSGVVCRYEDTAYTGFVSIQNHHMLTRWADPASSQVYLVDVDLDDVGIPWVCP